MRGFLAANDNNQLRNGNQQRALHRLMQLGTPYICWLHQPLANGQGQIVDELKCIMMELDTLGKFPSVFTKERIRGAELASHATILWDDPYLRPFSKTDEA